MISSIFTAGQEKHDHIIVNLNHFVKKKKKKNGKKIIKM